MAARYFYLSEVFYLIVGRECGGWGQVCRYAATTAAGLAQSTDLWGLQEVTYRPLYTAAEPAAPVSPADPWTRIFLA